MTAPTDLVLDTTWRAGWRPEFVGTLMFLLRGDEVLLIHKMRGHGKGLVNAPGGKWERGETLLETACRETREEVGMTVQDATCRAELRFVDNTGAQWLGFAFIARAFRGEPVASAEADPFWCQVADIPYESMWPDDAYWLPRILRANNADILVADFLFDGGQLIDHRFVEAQSIWQDVEG
jgi:8-oxo-dGTP diphosphatase